MTRIILILEYYPQGFFEKTGNLWRAVGRRARLEFKHFCRHVMMDTLINRDDLEGWRGEIRDSEVVKTHEEAIEEEQRAAAEDEDVDGEELAEDAEDAEDDEDAEDAEDADDLEEGFGDEELADDELADDEALDDLDEDELPEDAADDADDADDEGRQGSRRRQRAHA